MEKLKQVLDIIMWIIFVSICVSVLGTVLIVMIDILWNISKCAAIILTSLIVSGMWTIKRM